jgi:hypothetical protein
MNAIGNTLPRRFKAKASGAITAGKPLIVEADGDVLQISQTSVTQVAGTAVTFETGVTLNIRSAYDANAGKVVIAYQDSGNSDYGTAVVGTVDPSNNSISFGTPVVFESAYTSQYDTIACTYDANAQKVLISYLDAGNSKYGTAIVGTVSGTSISFGSAVVFESAETTHINSAYDDNAQKILIVYRDNGNSDYGTGIVATISGTSVSFGTPVVFESSRVEQNTVVYDSSAQKHAIFYKDVYDSGKGRAIVATVSGTSVSYGTAAVFDTTGSAERYGAAYDSSNSKIALGFDNGSDGKYIVGTISGTDISFGSQGTFNSGNVDDMSAVFDNVKNKVIFVWRYASGAGKLVSGTISGTSMSFDTTYEYNGGDRGDYNQKAAVWDNGNKRTVIPFRNASGGGALADDGMAVVFQTGGTDTNLTSENYIGIAEYAAADTETATVLIKGGVITSGTLVPLGFTFGSAAIFESATIFYGGSTYDSTNNRVVRTYRDNGNSAYGTAVVGSISGTTITWGTPVVFESASTNEMDIAFDSGNGKVVICYEDGGNSSHGTAIVGTVSGTSISFGSATVFESAEVRVPVITYDANAGKVVIAYNDDGNSNYGTAIVGTVSGTSISFGSAVVFNSANTSNLGMAYDANAQKIVIGYQDGSSGNALVGTVSGTSISFGSEATFESGTAADVSAVYDPDSQKVILSYVDEGDSNKGKAIVGTVSGTSISFGTETTFADHGTSMTENNCIAYDTTQDKAVIAYKDASSSELKTIIGTVSGTSISFGSAQVVYSGGANDITLVYDSNADSVVYMYKDAANDYGTGKAGQLSQELTPGQTYFVQGDGTLALTADSPSVTAGTAVASNKLIVKG